MSAPARVQLKRAKGWRMPPNTVKVDRSTRWGNPFEIRQRPGKMWNPHSREWDEMWEVRQGPDLIGIYDCKAMATHWAVLRFACEVAPLWDVGPLVGKNLACWCPEGADCHGDVLLELAGDLEATTSEPAQPAVTEPKLNTKRAAL